MVRNIEKEKQSGGVFPFCWTCRRYETSPGLEIQPRAMRLNKDELLAHAGHEIHWVDLSAIHASILLDAILDASQK